MTLLERVNKLVALATQVFSDQKAELATAKDKIAELEAALATALQNDAADAAAIAEQTAKAEAATQEATAAKQAAEAAAVKVAELQGLADADLAEDEAINAALDAGEAALGLPAEPTV